MFDCFQRSILSQKLQGRKLLRRIARTGFHQRTQNDMMHNVPKGCKMEAPRFTSPLPVEIEESRRITSKSAHNSYHHQRPPPFTSFHHDTATLPYSHLYLRIRRGGNLCAALARRYSSRKYRLLHYKPRRLTSARARSPATDPPISASRPPRRATTTSERRTSDSPAFLVAPTRALRTRRVPSATLSWPKRAQNKRRRAIRTPLRLVNIPTKSKSS